MNEITRFHRFCASSTAGSASQDASAEPSAATARPVRPPSSGSLGKPPRDPLEKIRRVAAVVVREGDGVARERRQRRVARAREAA